MVGFYENLGLTDAPRRIKTIVIVKVERAMQVVSPAYDGDATEDQIRARWEDHYAQIRPKT